jgi:nucleoside-diphosphate-sugar epimerase
MLRRMETASNQILITGACGWLGKRLTRLVAAREFDLDVLRHLPQSPLIRCLVLPGEDAEMLRALGAEVVYGDLRNPMECAHFCQGANGAVLLHTAGIIHPRRVKDFYEVNTVGTQNLLNAAIAGQVKRVVIVSSNSPIGINSRAGCLFDESSPYQPYMNYGRSKMQMELAVKEIGSSGRIETVLVRPPWFYGPDQPQRQTLFFSMIRQGKVPIVGSGDNLRSMAYIDNLCEGLLLAAFVRRARGQTYWIADRRPYSMNEIIDTVELLLEREFNLPVAHKRFRLPNLVSDVATLADRIVQGLGHYNQKIHVLSEMNKNIACSVAKAEAELGYNPRIALEEGMRRSLRYCVDRGIEI